MSCGIFINEDKIHLFILHSKSIDYFYSYFEKRIKLNEKNKEKTKMALFKTKGWTLQSDLQ